MYQFAMWTGMFGLGGFAFGVLLFLVVAKMTQYTNSQTEFFNGCVGLVAVFFASFSLLLLTLSGAAFTFNYFGG
jgi:hypothetical protein